MLRLECLLTLMFGVDKGREDRQRRVRERG